jgi:ferric-chelate reductase
VFLEQQIWRWQKTGRIYLAGEISLVAGIVIWITSLPQIRRKKFELFYYTHHLYIVLLVFFLFHAGDRHFYMIFPGIFLFGIDKILRIIQSRPETCILSARIFPSKAIELILPKDPSNFCSPFSVIGKSCREGLEIHIKQLIFSYSLQV